MDLKNDLIGLRIKYFRTERNMSQEELGELTGTTSRHIINIEMGKKGPSLSLLVAIANTLDVSANDLLVDNLTHFGDLIEYEVSTLMLDCNNTEKAILTKALKNLKALLSEHGI